MQVVAIAKYLGISATFLQINQWTVNPHITISLIDKSLLCNQWKVNPRQQKSEFLVEKNANKIENNQWKVNSWKINRAPVNELIRLLFKTKFI